MSVSLEKSVNLRDSYVSCYESLSYEDGYGFVEMVHEQRTDGSCTCGRVLSYREREAIMNLRGWINEHVGFWGAGTQQGSTYSRLRRNDLESLSAVLWYRDHPAYDA